MKFMKLTVLILGLVLFATGCIQSTMGTWQKKTYAETISHFLITKDASKIAFIGDQFHYIFKGQDNLSKILSWNYREKLTADFPEKFSVDGEENITGNYVIYCKCEDVQKHQLHQLLDAGFVENIENEKGTHIYTGKISGVRYLSNGQSFQHYSRLNNDYTITVKIPYSAAGIAGRALLTPIAVANDGIASIALIPLFILAIPFAIDMMLEDEQSPKQDLSTTTDSILI